MCNLIRCRKNLLIKGTAFATVLCLTFADLPMYAYAGEDVDQLHNTSDEVSNTGEKQKTSHVDSVYNLFNNDETKDQEKGNEEVKDKDQKDEESKDEEIKDQEQTDEELKDEETDTDKDTEESKKEEDGSDTDNDTKKEESKDTETDSVSGNDTEAVEKEDEGEKDSVSGNDIGEIEREEREIIDVVVPTSYTLALNPYRLPIMIREDETTTEQVISGNYGIVNKSSTDQIVTVTLTVEDHSGEQLVFVDSAEEAEEAGRNVYAIYLAAVPADEGEILIGEGPVEGDVTAGSLVDVTMTGAQEQAVTLHAGDNQISFRLAKAVYEWETGEETEEEDPEQEEDQEERAEGSGERIERTEKVFRELADDGQGVTAYTFYGVMNPDAEWERLSGGIRLSVVYTYQTAEGDEEIAEGTGALVRREERSGEEE